MNQNSLLQQFVEYAYNLQYSDIPPEAVQMAKWIIFDSLGTGLGGYQRELGQKAVRYGTYQMGGDQATLLGTGNRSSAEGAAFSNGVMIKILGMDDSHRTAGHIASEVIPAVLATAEVNQASGEEIITAIVAAYDLAVRIGKQVRFAQRERGLDLKGTIGTLAAAVASARCARLDMDGISNAVAIAADLCSGTEQYVYEGGKCDTKDLIAGFGARNGVFATSLASANFYGPDGALDGEYGFFRAFGDGYEADLFDDLGEHFAIVTTGFKPHGGCRHTHQAIDAVQAILKQGPLNPSDIENITIETYQYALQPSFRVDPNPPSRDVAGLSIRVSTAVALVRHSGWHEDFKHWDDPEVRRLRQIIDLKREPEIDAKYPELNGCRMRVSLSNGDTWESFARYMKGEPEFAMTGDELLEKFHVLTSQLFSKEHVVAIYAQCEGLENLENIGQLMAMTAVPELAGMESV